jgi:hypothetical protein
MIDLPIQRERCKAHARVGAVNSQHDRDRCIQVEQQCRPGGQVLAEQNEERTSLRIRRVKARLLLAATTMNASQKGRGPDQPAGPAIIIAIPKNERAARFAAKSYCPVYSGPFQLGSLEKRAGACCPVRNFS